MGAIDSRELRHAFGTFATGVTVGHFAGKVLDEEPDAATLECRPWNIYDGGDHIIVVGEVLSLEITKREPFLFFGGKFRQIGRLVEGSPWDHSSAAPESGWFAGSSSFKSLHVLVPPPAPQFHTHETAQAPLKEKP